MEIFPSIFYDHKVVRLDLNYRKKTFKNSNIWRLNNTLLNKQQITEEIKKESKYAQKLMKIKHNNTKPVGHYKAVLRGKLKAIQAYLKKQEKS